MRALDKLETVVFDGQLPVTVLSNADHTDFELVDIRPRSMAEFSLDILREQAKVRSLHFLGAIALVNGVPKTALTEPLDEGAMTALSSAYIGHVEMVCDALLETHELARLYALRDTRT